MKIMAINPFGETEFRGRENLEKIKRLFGIQKYGMMNPGQNY